MGKTTWATIRAIASVGLCAAVTAFGCSAPTGPASSERTDEARAAIIQFAEDDDFDSSYCSTNGEVTECKFPLPGGTQGETGDSVWSLCGFQQYIGKADANTVSKIEADETGTYYYDLRYTTSNGQPEWRIACAPLADFKGVPASGAHATRYVELDSDSHRPVTDFGADEADVCLWHGFAGDLAISTGSDIWSVSGLARHTTLGWRIDAEHSLATTNDFDSISRCDGWTPAHDWEYYASVEAWESNVIADYIHPNSIMSTTETLYDDVDGFCWLSGLSPRHTSDINADLSIVGGTWVYTTGNGTSTVRTITTVECVDWDQVP